MKVARILHFLILVLVLGYLFLLHNANQAYLNVPFFFDFPPALVIGVALVLGWLHAWFWSQLQLWRKKRIIRKLEARVRELEAQQPQPYSPLSEEPIIPDRTGVFQTPKHSPDYENF